MRKHILTPLLVTLGSISLVSCGISPLSNLTGKQQPLPAKAPQHIGVMLPLSGQFAQQGKTVRDGFLSSYYSAHTSQTISFYDTNQTKDMATLYQKALAEGADFVVGPLTKEDVSNLASHGSFTAPDLALNYTDIFFGSLPNNFFEFGLSPTDEAQQAAEKAKANGYSHALIIAMQDDTGQRMVKALSARWQALGGSVQDVLYVTPTTKFNEAVAGLLHINPKQSKSNTAEQNNAIVQQQRRRDFDVVFVLTPPQVGREVVPLLKYYYVNNTPIYSTSIIYSGSPSPQRDADLNGVIFCDSPAVLSGSRSNRLYSVGMDAYTLTQKLPEMISAPNVPVYGQTGTLTLMPSHKIYRQLAWATMHDGHP